MTPRTNRGHRAGGTLGVALLALAVLPGCVGKYKSDFSVSVVNRTANTIQVTANGSQLGEVASNATTSFTIKLSETGQNVLSNGVAPTPTADVTFTALDMKTGNTSTVKTATLTQGSPTYITFTSSDFPTVAATVARMTISPTNPGINQDVFFNATSSSGSSPTYVWDFGDGTNGNGVSVTHQYTRAGTFNVVLTVTSDNGQSSSTSRSVTISATLQPNSATFTFSPTNPAINQDVSFSVQTQAGGPGGGGATQGNTYTWEFGDGTTGNGANVTHRYTTAGTYTVTLRVANTIGQTASSSRTITVSANLPAGSVNFTFSPTNPGINDDVFFNASATTVANATFSWNFGDGESDTGMTPVHRFASPGTFTVTLTVRNALSQQASISRTITVSSASSGIVADFTFSPTDPSISRGTNSVIFDATPSTSNVTGWRWDFGDGNDVGTAMRVTHTYSRVGTWVVRLTVTDSSGRTASVSKNVTVAQ